MQRDYVINEKDMGHECDSGQGKMTYGNIVSELKVTPTAVVFIRIVPTVIVVVTLPAARHAAVVLTSELVRLTCPLRCPNHKVIIITNEIKTEGEKKVRFY